ncbi:accessory Sec system protein Asp2 [Listeria kieliensis]
MINTIKKFLSRMYILVTLFFEKQFKTPDCTLRYLLFKKKKTKRLLVIFSSYPGKDRPARYNYILKFKKLRTSRLYILDNFGFDKRGAYYLGENKDFYIERAVHELIESVRKELELEKENVILTGSSKGGFAAMYFENKYDYGASVVGAPQVRLGNYLRLDWHKQIFEFIMGEVNDQNCDFLNDLLFDMINQKETKPNISIHVSKQESMYTKHVVPLLDFLEDVDCDLDLDFGNYKNHSDVGPHFANYALKQIPLLFKKLEQKN